MYDILYTLHCTALQKTQRPQVTWNKSHTDMQSIGWSAFFAHQTNRITVYLEPDEDPAFQEVLAWLLNPH